MVKRASTAGPHAAPAPEAAVENKQRLVDLRGAFQGLSESHHQLLVMREFEGLSYDQIGERLGMSRPVVESSLFRARRKLNEEYQELVSGRRCEAVQGVIASEDERSLRSLGVRQRRLLSRHLAHCQPCRRVARDAHLDESWFKAPPVRSKLAALLPFGWWRWRWREPKDEEGAASLAATVPHHVLLSPPWSGLAALGNATASMPGAGRAAAAAAAIAVAGLGGSAITGIGNGWVPGVGGGGSHQAASRRGPNPGSAGAARSSAAGRGSAAGISASAVVAGATQFQAPSQLASAAASASGRRTSGLHAAGTSPAAASAVRLPSGASTASSLPGIALPTNAGQTPTLPATPTSPVGAPAHGSGLVPAGSSVVKYGLGPARGAAGTVGEVTERRRVDGRAGGSSGSECPRPSEHDRRRGGGVGRKPRRGGSRHDHRRYRRCRSPSRPSRRFPPCPRFPGELRQLHSRQAQATRPPVEYCSRSGRGAAW